MAIMDGRYHSLISICISIDMILCPPGDIFSSCLKQLLLIKGSPIPGISESEFPGEKIN